jgi:epoxyqueuosine reductase
MTSLKDRLKAHARRLGFDLVGIAPAAPPPGYASFREWLAKGHAGEMGYLERHADARGDPRSILPDVRSVVMVAMNYRQPPAPHDRSRRTGRVASYAQGADYHDVLWDRLGQLLKWVQQEVPGAHGRAVADTAPLLERDYARLAGLGWCGKNAMLLNTELGSFFFLGALLLDLPLAPDPPMPTDHCGTCTACLDACPTDAFVAPGRLDARRCISYLTIELKGPVPPERRSGMGDWVFGCDVCQDVCPWNHKAPLATEPAFAPRPDQAMPDLEELLRLTPAQFRERFRGTALTRPKRRGLLRNAAVALGNRGDPRAVPVLIEALHDEEPLVRGAAAWALGRLGTGAAREALRSRWEGESDDVVRAEIEKAMPTDPGSVRPAHTAAERVE